VSGFAVSRVTLFSFLLAMLLATGLLRWNAERRDACSEYQAGDRTAPASIYAVSGARAIVVPCNDWLARQPMTVQILCLVELVLMSMFVLNGLMDLRDWRKRRRQD